MMKVQDLFPSRLTIFAVLGCVVFIPLAIFMSYSYGVTQRDLTKVSAEKVVVSQQLQKKTEELAVCAAQRDLNSRVLKDVERSMEKLRQESDTYRRNAEARLRTERARTQAAERGRQALLRQQPQANETICEAAWRIHRENLD